MFRNVCPEKIHISLYICSESLLGTIWIAKDAIFIYANNKDWSDCNGAQAVASSLGACQNLCLPILRLKIYLPKTYAKGNILYTTINNLTLVLMNPDIPCLCKQCSSRFCLTLVQLNPAIAFLCKQCRSRSVGFWRSQLIWICTVCH